MCVTTAPATQVGHVQRVPMRMCRVANASAVLTIALHAQALLLEAVLCATLTQCWLAVCAMLGVLLLDMPE